MTTVTDRKIALVTGANRGMGKEACRQLAGRGFLVMLTSRNAESGQQAAKELDSSGKQIVFHQLDVTNSESVHRIEEFVLSQYGRFDVLINNAGISLDVAGAYLPQNGKNGTREGHTIFDIPKEKLIKTFETNTIGAVLMCQAFIPLMRKNHYGRIVNVSSQMGQLESMGTDWPAYRISKTALNAVTRIFANEVKDFDILINSVHPGWVKTDMGGSLAPKAICEGVETIIWAATLPKGGPTGQFLRDKKPIGW